MPASLARPHCTQSSPTFKPNSSSQRSASCITTRNVSVSQDINRSSAFVPDQPTRSLGGRGATYHRLATAASAEPTATSATVDVASAEVKAVLFDMDGVLCNSEIVSRRAAAEVMKELYGLDVSPDEFIPFTGTGEANFLGGVARKYGAPFEVESCKAKFFEIYMAKYAVPGAGIGYNGAKELVQACRAAGLRTAVASSADLVKVHANLSAADIPLDLFDAIVSADAFERLKPFPDIFLAAASQLGIHTCSCVVIEDAVAGVEAARAAGMRVLGVTTTLAEEAMQAAGPDVMLSDISVISVETLTGLKLREGGEVAIAAAKAKVAAAIGNEVESHDNVSTGTSMSSTTSTSGSWLDQYVPLPGGYRTTRRDALKFVSLGAALGSGWVALTRAKTMSYASPKALLNALLPRAVPSSPGDATDPAGRVAAFKRFIGELEARGAGEIVPEFPAGAEWLNAPPLRLSKELSGKVIVLDFWTFCCINCMHVLPDLAYLESKFHSQPFAVVGVHSAKFDAESNTDAIRNAVLRYDIQHPVVNDRAMAMWRALGISSWPTMAVISPTGRILLSLPGENHRADLDDLITAALEYYGERGLLNAAPVPTALEKEKDPRLVTSALRYPGKVAIDAVNERVFVSDTGNHRIVVVNAQTGEFIEAIGGCGPGSLDGTFQGAMFHSPQGLSYNSANNRLYVCDTESHAVREVDFDKRIVRTLVGNGTKGEDYRGGRSGGSQPINSPWDCQLVSFSSQEANAGDNNEGERVAGLLVAMAGLHQIWKVDLETGKATAISGSGYERNQNGPTPQTTAWAQPSGLAVVPGSSTVYVADSESSSIRIFDVSTGASMACVGGDPLFSDNLFKFGDRDGAGPSALLQHPLAVAPSPDGSTIYVADSYNHKIKAINRDAGSIITTLVGTGSAGFQDGNASANHHGTLSEPGGLAVFPDGRVLIADTNNFVLRVLNPTTRALSTFELRGVPPPRVSPDAAAAFVEVDGKDGGIPEGAIVVKASSQGRTGARGTLKLRIVLPEGYHLTPGANSRFECTSAATPVPGGGAHGADAVKLTPVKGPLREERNGATATVQYSGATGNATLRVLATVYYCKDRSVCLFQEVVFVVDVGSNSDHLAEADEGGNVVEMECQLSAQAPVVDLPLI